LLARTILILLALLVGCQDESDQLTLADLTAGERQVVERFIVLERARAVALANPALGAALLDSLAAAWGDSAQLEAEALLPTEPRRAARVHALLQELLAAEQDSLVLAPEPRRLQVPID
jgi:hypothetical protein